MESTIRILHLEDNPNDALLVQSILKRANMVFEYFLSDSEKEYQSYLEDIKFDIILSDYHLPDYSGTEALQFAKNNYPHIPFVFLSGTMGEDTAIESMLNGATDYVLKNKMERLVPAINRAFNESQAYKARVNAERALYQSEENFRRSISESPLGIRIVAVDGDTIYANKAFLDIYEFSSLKEYTSTPAKERYSTESYLEHLHRKEIRRNGMDVMEYELSIVRGNGEIRHVKILRNEVLWDGVKHYQVINQDITEQKNLTKELIAAKEKAEESDRLKSAFLANMSHEIRTPMNGILGFAELLKEKRLTAEESFEYISMIEQSGVRLLNLLEEIITISTIESGHVKVNMQETNINAQIAYIYARFKPIAEGKGLQLYSKTPLSSLESVVCTDCEKIVEILTNLVKNAIKFSDKGTIEFGYDIVETHGRASLLQFYVKDQGIGIPKERQEAIFERFIQADISDKRAFQGAGLGLSITKAYVEMLGGKIWVESEVGKGSIFYFTLPCNAERQ